MARVVAAHGALQLGEFTHHVGQQIGLGQARGLHGLCGQRVATELFSNGTGNSADAFHALALAAQLVVINHFAQAFDARLECLFAVLVKEELRIGQARAHHALIAANHRARVGGADVADDQKLVAQLACLVEQRKVLLVGLHGQNQALLRHLQKGWLKAAGQHIGAFHQRSHLVQECFVVHRLRTQRGSSSLQLACDVGAARLKAGNHRTVARQGGGVVVGVGKHHVCQSRFKAVALGGVACAQAQRGDRHHGAAVQGDQAMGRAHKAHRGPAGQFAVALELVAHDLGDG